MTVKVTFDEVTLKLLELLQTDSEISHAELAERVGISTSPCWRRVADLKSQGVIRGAVVLVESIEAGAGGECFCSCHVRAAG